MSESGGKPAGREVRLTEILRPEHVVAPLPAASVYDAVMHLAQTLVGTGDVPHPDRLQRMFSESRVRDLIHVGDRVLLPHLRTDAVDSLQVALGIAPRPLPESPDHVGAVAQIVVLVLAPLSAADLYLQTVAALARVLRARRAWWTGWWRRARPRRCWRSRRSARSPSSRGCGCAT